MHSGHRDRMKRRFQETGLRGFDDINALEFLLFYAIPRRDTNPIAHALIERFGSFHAVLDAPYEAIVKVPGVGENTAILLKLIPAICKRYTQGKQKRRMAFTCIEDLENYVIPLFSFDMEETLFLICMDSGNRITYCEPISQGDIDSVRVDTRRIVEIALERKAVRVVLAHNHPSGIAAPSMSDISLTQKVKDSLELFNIELLDHFIVAEETSVSLRRHGCIR